MAMNELVCSNSITNSKVTMKECYYYRREAGVDMVQASVTITVDLNGGWVGVLCLTGVKVFD